jgi:hypothetical protein
MQFENIINRQQEQGGICINAKSLKRLEAIKLWQR